MSGLREARDRLRDDSGAVAVIVAILVIALLGLAALAVDLGYFYNVRRALQAAADAGALAGAQELGMSGDATLADAIARDYAGVRNAVAPADGVVVDSVQLGSDYVQVTVSKDAPYFFGRTAGGAGGGARIRATSRARLDYVTGLRGLVPWFIPVLNPGTVSVALSGGSDWYSLTGGGGDWSGSLSTGISAPAPLPPDGKKVNRTVTGHPVKLRARNKYGVDLVLDPAGCVVAAPTDAPITDIEVANNIVDPNGECRIVVQTSTLTSATPTVSSGIGMSLKSVASVAGGKRYTFSGTAPSPSSQVTPYFFSVSVTDANGGTFTVSQAACIVVRSSTYAYLDGQMSPTYFVGTSGGVHVDVSTLSPDDFLAGDTYMLKSNPTMAEYGNFFAIDLSDPGGSAYRDGIIYGSPDTVYVGQTLYTETGNMVGPTGQGVDGRFGSDTCSYDWWISHEKPACPRLVYIPIVEWKDSPNGKTPVVVTGFAAFFIEETQNAAGDVRVDGRFVQYVGIGIPGPVPDPVVTAVKTARLVSDGVSF